MNHAYCDIGSYSIKILFLKQDKKGFSYLSHKDIPHAVADFDLRNLEHLRNAFETISKNLQEVHFDGKVIFRAPEQFLTTRYLEVPVPQKKKAEMMLPFQLDDNLPYPSSHAHLTAYYSKKGNLTEVHATITKKDEFSAFYEEMEASHFLPNLMASNSGFYHNFIRWCMQLEKADKRRPVLKKNALFLDIGHTTTKAIFVSDGQVVGNSISYFGGKQFIKKIEDLYGVSFKEATKYLQTQAFFLTPEQYKSVNRDQQVFGHMMEETVTELIKDIQKWDLGIKVKLGQSFDAIYISGGCSNIKNIENAIALGTKIKCYHLDLSSLMNSASHLEKSIKNSITPLLVMAGSSFYPSPVPNLLKGEFSPAQGRGLPLHSTVFISSRVLFISLCLIFFLVLEKAFLIRDNKIVTSQLNNLIKSPKLDFNKNDERRYSRNLKDLKSLMAKKSKQVKQEVTTILAANSANATSALVKLSQVIQANSNVDLMNFESNREYVRAIFKGKNKDELNLLRDRIQNSGIALTKVELTEKDTVLTIEFSPTGVL